MSDKIGEDELIYNFRSREDGIIFERTSSMEGHRLVYSSRRCNGCGMCAEACPREAISLEGPIGAINKGVSSVPYISIDPEKCVICGICSAVCLLGAIDIEINDERVKRGRRFVNYEGVYIFNQEQCTMKDREKLIPCGDCKLACQRGAITFAGIQKAGAKSINTIERDEGRCVFCSACERACPHRAIKVRKVFEGEVTVDQELCQGCGSCEEICPIGAIYLPGYREPWEKYKKVETDSQICCFCSACEKVCPVDAIEVKRSKVRYAWDQNKPLRKVWKEAFEGFVE